MFIRVNKTILFVLFIFSYAMSACGPRGGGDSPIRIDNLPKPVPKPEPEKGPRISLIVSTPTDIIYIDNQIKSTLSSVPMLDYALKTLTTSSIALYTASGDGGLGADFDTNSALHPFAGISFKTTFFEVENASQTFAMNVTGDKECENIFVLDQQNSIIHIDASLISYLISCHIKLTASAFSKETNITKTDAKEFNIALNPTLSMYAVNNDPTYIYLKSYSTKSDVEHVAKWLKDLSIKSQSLDLSYNSNFIKDGTILKDINALTGLKNLSKINLANTGLNNVKAFSYLKNLNTINLSGTKIENSNLTPLTNLTKIQSLNIANTDVKSIKVLADNLTSLTNLDISYNKNINDIESISSLKNLNSLTASSVNLKNFNSMKNLDQLKIIDVSKNDFSKISEQDITVLTNVLNLEELNISNSHMPDNMLNTFFSAGTTKSNLKKFIDQNTNNLNTNISEATCAYQSNNFKNTPNFASVQSLEYIDIHGNGCKIADNKYIGLEDASYFSVQNMPNLKYLDISNTTITAIKALAHTNLTQLHVFHHPIDNKGNVVNEGGINITKTSCILQLGEHNPLNSECDFLNAGSLLPPGEWRIPGEHKIDVPKGVYFVSVEVCSGGDGGQGGQGGQGGFTNFSTDYDYPTDTNTWTLVRCSQVFENTPKLCTYYNKNSVLPGLGALGGQGGVSSVSGIISSNHDVASQSYNGLCDGGEGGDGGKAGNGASEGFHFYPSQEPIYLPKPINGIKGSKGAAKSLSKLNNVPVIPGQTLTIVVGSGGEGGLESDGSKNSGCELSQAGQVINENGSRRVTSCGLNGEAGKKGTNGKPGYVKINWIQ